MMKKLLLGTIVLGAIGGPYLASTSPELWNSVSSHFAGSSGETKPAAAMAPPAVSYGSAPATSAYVSAAPLATGTVSVVGAARPPLEGFSIRDLGEVLRFDISPQWVMARWPRVTASLAELDLQGYRVPLVTGTSRDDLAGSLTYYFDKTHHVTHIHFRGTTGDPRKIIALATSRYQFLPQQTDDPSLVLYQVKWNGKAQSEMRIRSARVLRADQPLTNYQIELAMKRP